MGMVMFSADGRSVLSVLNKEAEAAQAGSYSVWGLSILSTQ